MPAKISTHHVRKRLNSLKASKYVLFSLLFINCYTVVAQTVISNLVLNKPGYQYPAGPDTNHSPSSASDGSIGTSENYSLSGYNSLYWPRIWFDLGSVMTVRTVIAMERQDPDGSVRALTDNKYAAGCNDPGLNGANIIYCPRCSGVRINNSVYNCNLSVRYIGIFNLPENTLIALNEVLAYNKYAHNPSTRPTISIYPGSVYPGRYLSSPGIEKTSIFGEDSRWDYLAKTTYSSEDSHLYVQVDFAAKVDVHSVLVLGRTLDYLSEGFNNVVINYGPQSSGWPEYPCNNGQKTTQTLQVVTCYNLNVYHVRVQKNQPTEPLTIGAILIFPCEVTGHQAQNMANMFVLYNQGFDPVVVSFDIMAQTDCGLSQPVDNPVLTYVATQNGQVSSDLQATITIDGNSLSIYNEQATNRRYQVQIFSSGQYAGEFELFFAKCFLGQIYKFEIHDKVIMEIPDAGLIIHHDPMVFQQGQEPIYEAYLILFQERRPLPEGLEYDPASGNFTISQKLSKGEYWLQVIVTVDCNKEEWKFPWILKYEKLKARNANKSPFYLEELPSVSGNTGEELSFQLPDPIEPEQERVKFSINLGRAVIFMTVNEEKGEFFIAKGATTPNMAGVYPIQVTLEDVHGNTSEKYQFTLILFSAFNIEEDETEQGFNFDFNIEEQENDRPDKFSRLMYVNSFYQKEPRPYFKQLTATGQAIIWFSKEMDLKNTTDPLPIEIYTFKLDDQNSTDVNYTQIIKNHTVIDFEPQKGFTIQFEFNNPYEISNTIEDIDVLLINFEKGIDYFVDIDGNKMLKDFVKIEKQIPRQVPSQEEAQNLESGGEAATQSTFLVFAGNLVLTYMIGGAIAQMLGVFDSFVILSHLTLVNVLVPANVNLFLQYITFVASFDVVPFMDEMYEATIGPAEQEGVSENFEDLGYETTLVMQNLGSLYILIVLQWILFLFVVLVDRQCQNRLPKLNQFFERRGCKWGYFIQFFLSNFFMIVLTAVIGLKNISLGVNTLDPGLNLSNITTILHLIIIPVIIGICIKLLSQKIEEEHLYDKKTIKGLPLKPEEKEEFQNYANRFNKQHAEKFARKYGPLTETIKGRQRTLARRYLILKFFRSFLFAIAVVFYVDKPFMQIIFLYAYTFSSFIFYAVFSPIEQNDISIKNMINQYFFIVQLQHFCCYTDYIPDPETRYLIGYSQLMFVIIQFFYNLGPLMLSTCTPIVRKYKKKCCKSRMEADLKKRQIKSKEALQKKRKEEQERIKEVRKTQKRRLRFESYRRFLFHQLVQEMQQSNRLEQDMEDPYELLQQAASRLNQPTVPDQQFELDPVTEARLFKQQKNYLNNFIALTGGVPADFKILSYNGEKTEYEHQVKYEQNQTDDAESEDQQDESQSQTQQEGDSNAQREDQVEMSQLDVQKSDTVLQLEQAAVDDNIDELLRVPSNLIDDRVKNLDDCKQNWNKQGQTAAATVVIEKFDRSLVTIDEGSDSQEEDRIIDMDVYDHAQVDNINNDSEANELQESITSSKGFISMLKNEPLMRQKSFKGLTHENSASKNQKPLEDVILKIDDKELDLIDNIEQKDEKPDPPKEESKSAVSQKEEEDRILDEVKEDEEAKRQAERQKQIDAFKREEVDFEDEIPEKEVRKYRQKNHFSMDGNIAKRVIKRTCTLFDGTTKVLTKTMTREII